MNADEFAAYARLADEISSRRLTGLYQSFADSVPVLVEHGFLRVDPSGIARRTRKGWWLSAMKGDVSGRVECGPFASQADAENRMMIEFPPSQYLFVDVDLVSEP